MIGFLPCTHCRRHVKTSEARCVFCGNEPALGAGMGARTIAILSAAALTVVACNDPPKPVMQPDPVPSASVSPASVPDPTPTASVAASASAGDPTVAPSSSVATSTSPMPPTPTRPQAMRYGIAPNRKPTPPTP